MRIVLLFLCVVCLGGCGGGLSGPASAAAPPVGLKIHWEKNLLTIVDGRMPHRTIEINYLEAYCRPGSTDRDWHQTVIPHTTELIEQAADGRRIRMRNRLADGVVVEHLITAGADEVDFQLTATNPGPQDSQAHWAQPCIRLDRFIGVPRAHNSEDYLPKCFIFLDGKPARMPTPKWATKAMYTPGQVWRPPHVPPDDVNPRPVSPLTPSNGLIGCFTGDEVYLMATAWEPYQELFQGVLVCLHSDFRLGGLKAGQTLKIRGKLYILPGDIPTLLGRYRKDFPEHGK